MDGLARGLYGVIKDDVWQPELFVKGRAALPGAYISAATTAAELDRLQDLLEARLAFVEILLVCVSRFDLNAPALISWGLRQVRQRLLRFPPFARKFRRSSIRGAYLREWKIPLCERWAQVRRQLRKASEIAEMLDDDHARTRVARAWIEADRVFLGVTNWKAQALYLP